jgi:ferredoxin--NADP+ reductase
MNGFEVVSKRVLAPAVTLLDITAPRIARKARAGQFIILRVDETGERVPLTIADRDSDRGTVTIVFQAVGYTTRQLAEKNVGDRIPDLLGPLGKPTEVRNYGRVICAAGGVGIAFMYPEIKAFAEAGNEITSVLAARSQDLLFFVDEIKALSRDFYIATDDGSLGHHGLITDVLRRLLESDTRYGYCIAIGPLPMMRATTSLTREFNLPTLVSLDPVMVDGTGMCGGCRVTVGGETKFACVDGPEFDGHLVDFDELAKRKRTFFDEEQCLLDPQLDQLTREKA